MRTIMIGVVGTALILGVLGITNDWPASLFVFAGVVFGSSALGVALRRWVDRSVAKELARRATPFKVRYQSYAFGGAGIYEVTTTFSGGAKWFILYDLKQSAGLRLSRRLGLGRRLDIDDDGFNREIYVERNPEVGAVLFASAERREAARATPHGILRHRIS